MLVVCEHCARPLNLPDDKIPDRAFSMTCPYCKGRLQIDPAAAPPPPAPAEPAPAEPAPPEPLWNPSGAPRPRSPHDTGSFSRLAPLSGTDQALFDLFPPVALVASLELPPAPELTALLQAIGMEEVRHFRDLQEACDESLESGVGILLVRVDKAAPPPFEALRPIYRLPADVRRRLVVALLAENVRSLDGQAAFYLQVNCVLNSQEMETFPSKLRRAVLHHLRHYRYWGVEE